MGKALVGIGGANSNMASGRFLFLGCAIAQGGVSTEAQAAVVSRVPGTFSKLAMKIDATGTGRAYRFRKNGANASMSLNPPDTTSGVYEDVTNTDSLAAGDTFCVSTSHTGSPRYDWYRTVFEADGSHACFYMGASTFTFSTNSVTRYVAFAGTSQSPGPTATEANAQAKLRVPGILKNFQVYVLTNTRATDTSLKVRINGGDATISVTVAAGATGLFEDTANTDTVADGDLVNFALVTGSGGGDFVYTFAGCAIEASTGSANDLFGANINGVSRGASSTPSYVNFHGLISNVTTEGQRKLQHGFDGTASRMRMHVSANTCIGDVTVAFRKNGADGNQTLTIGAGATGWFEDGTHEDSFTATDDCCVQIVGGTTGSITYTVIGLTEDSGGVSAYDLSCGDGGFAAAGHHASLRRGFENYAGAISISAAGQAATLGKGFPLDGQPSALALGMPTSELVATWRFDAEAFSVGFGGEPTGLLRGRRLVAASVACVSAAGLARLASTRRTVGSAGALGCSGLSAGLRSGWRIAIAPRVLVSAGAGAATRATRLAAADAHAPRVSGALAQLLAGRRTSVGLLTAGVDVAAANLLSTRRIAAFAVSVTATGGRIRFWGGWRGQAAASLAWTPVLVA